MQVELLMSLIIEGAVQVKCVMFTRSLIACQLVISRLVLRHCTTEKEGSGNYCAFLAPTVVHPKWHLGKALSQLLCLLRHKSKLS